MVGLPHILTFESLYSYDLRELGITIPVELSIGEEGCAVPSRLDSGAAFCIFQRDYGEILGLDIEGGDPQWIETPTGRFLTYGHGVSLTALDLTHDMVAYFAENREFTRNVLGRTWMQRMRLGIIDYEGQIYSN